MSVALNLRGLRVGSVTVIEESHRTRVGVVWSCRCDCGAMFTRSATNIMRGHRKHYRSACARCTARGKPLGNRTPGVMPAGENRADGMTWAEIGAALGMSGSRAEQIAQNAIRKLKRRGVLREWRAA